MRKHRQDIWCALCTDYHRQTQIFSIKSLQAIQSDDSRRKNPFLVLNKGPYFNYLHRYKSVVLHASTLDLKIQSNKVLIKYGQTQQIYDSREKNPTFVNDQGAEIQVFESPTSYYIQSHKV